MEQEMLVLILSDDDFVVGDIQWVITLSAAGARPIILFFHLVPLERIDSYLVRNEMIFPQFSKNNFHSQKKLFVVQISKNTKDHRFRRRGQRDLHLENA